jgi:hypothetical protein
MEFVLKYIPGEDNYPTDIFLYDTNNLIAEYKNPLHLNMLELERLFEAMRPLVEAYREWIPRHEKFMYGEIKKKPVMRKV